MTTYNVLNCILIAIGAVIMLVCIVKSKKIADAVQFIPKSDQTKIRHLVCVHRGMMIFFFLGYAVVLISFVFNLAIISALSVSIIFFIGAVFVLTGITAQTILFSKIQTTLQGILPICSVCKKIRTDDADPKNPKSWKNIEEYVSGRSNVGFSHGYCPECFEHVMSRLKRQQ